MIIESSSKAYHEGETPSRFRKFLIIYFIPVTTKIIIVYLDYTLSLLNIKLFEKNKNNYFFNKYMSLLYLLVSTFTHNLQTNKLEKTKNKVCHF